MPGTTATYGGNPTPSVYSTDGCSAWLEYTETHTLDWYPYL